MTYHIIFIIHFLRNRFYENQLSIISTLSIKFVADLRLVMEHVPDLDTYDFKKFTALFCRGTVLHIAIYGKDDILLASLLYCIKPTL